MFFAKEFGKDDQEGDIYVLFLITEREKPQARSRGFLVMWLLETSTACVPPT